MYCKSVNGISIYIQIKIFNQSSIFVVMETDLILDDIALWHAMVGFHAELKRWWGEPQDILWSLSIFFPLTEYYKICRMSGSRQYHIQLDMKNAFLQWSTPQFSLKGALVLFLSLWRIRYVLKVDNHEGSYQNWVSTGSAKQLLVESVLAAFHTTVATQRNKTLSVIFSKANYIPFSCAS